MLLGRADWLSPRVLVILIVPDSTPDGSWQACFQTEVAHLLKSSHGTERLLLCLLFFPFGSLLQMCVTLFDNRPRPSITMSTTGVIRLISIS